MQFKLYWRIVTEANSKAQKRQQDLSKSRVTMATRMTRMRRKTLDKCDEHMEDWKTGRLAYGDYRPFRAKLMSVKLGVSTFTPALPA